MKTLIARMILIVPLIGAAAVAQNAIRPPQVPEEYVITPFGYFHPSCVRHVVEGEMILADGRLQHANGTADATAPVCNYPAYSSQGWLRAADQGTKTPATNGWVEYISTTTSAAYGKITASWKTPPVPNTNNGQTLFFFPGFEDKNDVISIVQPVLQWGPSAAGGGYYWGAASWNCCISGIADYSTVINVSAGDTMIGSITSNCAAGSRSCATWNILTEDETSAAKTSLKKTVSDGQVWNWAFGSVMEVYGVVACPDYPKNGGITFSVQLYDQNLALISNPGWVVSPASVNTSPSCGFGLSSTTTKETVKYTP